MFYNDMSMDMYEVTHKSRQCSSHRLRPNRWSNGQCIGLRGSHKAHDVPMGRGTCWVTLDTIWGDRNGKEKHGSRKTINTQRPLKNVSGMALNSRHLP